VKPRHIYHTCPDCGANLDPGEKCDCKDKPKDLPSCDRLNISVDFSEKDEGCVVVSRNKGKGQNVVRMFYSKEAEQLYRYLINDLESTMDAIIKNEKEITND
jgi:hypothetical protein